MTELCQFCRNGIGPEYKNEFYKIKYKTYCSVQCFWDDDLTPETKPSKKKKDGRKKRK